MISSEKMFFDGEEAVSQKKPNNNFEKKVQSLYDSYFKQTVTQLKKYEKDGAPTASIFLTRHFWLSSNPLVWKRSLTKLKISCLKQLGWTVWVTTRPWVNRGDYLLVLLRKNPRDSIHNIIRKKRKT